MTSSMAPAGAVTFVWLGMVVAISFLEAPLKFRAPGVTLEIGLGIGRLVFRALNIAELVLAGVLASAILAEMPIWPIITSGTVPVLVLALQLGLVRSHLTRRSNEVLAGEDVPHSNAHNWYVGLEVVKVVGLLTTGILMLAK